MARKSIFTVMERIAEERIADAQRRGEFKNLPGSGKPLKLEDESHVPDELRLAYKILKNANCLPPELQLKNEIRTTEELLRGITDEEEKYRQLKKINYLVMKLNLMRKRPVSWEENQRYYGKMVERVGQKKITRTGLLSP